MLPYIGSKTRQSICSLVNCNIWLSLTFLHFFFCNWSLLLFHQICCKWNGWWDKGNSSWKTSFENTIRAEGHKETFVATRKKEMSYFIIPLSLPTHMIFPWNPPSTSSFLWWRMVAFTSVTEQESHRLRLFILLVFCGLKLLPRKGHLD